MVGALKTKLLLKIRFFNHDILWKKVSWLCHNHDISVVNHDIVRIFQDILKMLLFTTEKSWLWQNVTFVWQNIIVGRILSLNVTNIYPTIPILQDFRKLVFPSQYLKSVMVDHGNVIVMTKPSHLLDKMLWLDGFLLVISIVLYQQWQYFKVLGNLYQGTRIVIVWEPKAW